MEGEESEKRLFIDIPRSSIEYIAIRSISVKPYTRKVVLARVEK